MKHNIITQAIAIIHVTILLMSHYIKFADILKRFLYQTLIMIIINNYFIYQ